MEKTTEAKDESAQTPQLSPTEEARRYLELEDYKNNKELADFIEANPTYITISRGIFKNPKDFRWFIGKDMDFPLHGIKGITIENMEDPKDLYDRVKLRFLRLNPNRSIVPFTDDPITGLQNILQACYEADKPKDHLITLAVAVKEIHVSRSTIKRAIKDERLKAYRSPNAAKNSPIKIDAVEALRIWPQK